MTKSDGHDRALPPSEDRACAPPGLSQSPLSQAEPLVPSAVLDAFVRESNHIEGIRRTTAVHFRAHAEFLLSPVTPNSLIVLVARLQPNARIRNTYTVPGVRVGNHVAPPSGPHISEELRRILNIYDPWEQHIAYETLHPFTDGNGRSGRALWLHRHLHGDFDPYAADRGFLHSFYYHTLSGVRLASAIDTRSATTAGRGPKDESAGPQEDAHD